MTHQDYYEQVEEMRQESTSVDTNIANRKSDYAKGYDANLILSPDRGDMFADKQEGKRTVQHALQEQEVKKERARILKAIAAKKEEGTTSSATISNMGPPPPSRKRKSRWDDAQSEASEVDVKKKKKSKWDDGPEEGKEQDASYAPLATPLVASGANAEEYDYDEENNLALLQQELSKRKVEGQQLQAPQEGRPVEFRPWTDDELNMMFPTEGYAVLDPPQGYEPKHLLTKASNLAAPTPMGASKTGFLMNTQMGRDAYGINTSVELGGGDTGLPVIKAEEAVFFQKLIDDVGSTAKLTKEDKVELAIMELLLHIKNGDPQQRKLALRNISDRARDFGPAPLFKQILPLLMSPSLEDQDRHLLVKVLDRIMFQLSDLVSWVYS